MGQFPGDKAGSISCEGIPVEADSRAVA